MAFNNLGKFGIDKSDMRLWASSGAAKAFVADVIEQKELAFKRLLKDGEKLHGANAESYKAFDKILRMMENASKLK